jgi:hypothetical protein
MGRTYPSLIVYADRGRGRSHPAGVLSLHCSPHGKPAVIELRVKQMCSVPPYDRDPDRARFLTGLRGLGIPRLEVDDAAIGARPGIPLDDLTDGRAERLLRLVDRWIEQTRAHARRPALTTNEV